MLDCSIGGGRGSPCGRGLRGRISLELELFSVYRWTKMAAGFGGILGCGGGVSCKLWFCDLACTFYFHFSRSENILWVWLKFSFHFVFPFNCVGQFWGALDMNKILVCVFTWRVGHNLLGSFLNTLWFLEMLWNGDCERTVAVITAVCHSLWIHPTQTGFFLYTWLVSFPLKRWDWKKATCFCWYLWACLFNFTWFCCINHWILV